MLTSGMLDTPYLFGSEHEGVPASTSAKELTDTSAQHTQGTQAFFTQVRAALRLTTLRPALVDSLGWIEIQEDDLLVPGRRFL